MQNEHHHYCYYPKSITKQQQKQQEEEKEKKERLADLGGAVFLPLPHHSTNKVIIINNKHI
jgi:hypothetical protein